MEKLWRNIYHLISVKRSQKKLFSISVITALKVKYIYFREASPYAHKKSQESKV